MSAESLSSAGRRHSLVAIIASTFGIGVNLGIVTPLATLILERDGVNAAFIKAYEVGGGDRSGARRRGHGPLGPAWSAARGRRGPFAGFLLLAASRRSRGAPNSSYGAKSCLSFVTFGWLTSPGPNSSRNPGTGTANAPLDDHVR